MQNEQAAKPMANILTTEQVARFLGVSTWMVVRVFRKGMLPEPERFRGARAIPRSLVPQIVDALRERGWLATEAK